MGHGERVRERSVVVRESMREFSLPQKRYHFHVRCVNRYHSLTVLISISPESFLWLGLIPQHDAASSHALIKLDAWAKKSATHTDSENSSDLTGLGHDPQKTLPRQISREEMPPWFCRCSFVRKMPQRNTSQLPPPPSSIHESFVWANRRVKRHVSDSSRLDEIGGLISEQPCADCNRSKFPPWLLQPFWPLSVEERN